MNQQKLFDFLDQVNRPVRFLGNEFGVRNNPAADLHCCLIFPHLYEVGMSSLGYRILYQIGNNHPRASLERAFTVTIEDQELLEQMDLKLFSLESKTPLLEFDQLWFSINYEMLLPEAARLLLISGIEPERERRNPGAPLIVFGGSGLVNPEPASAMADLIFLGDGEEFIPILQDYSLKFSNRDQLLQELSRVKGVYLPGDYQRQMSGQYLIPTACKQKVSLARVEDFNQRFNPADIIVPYGKIVHNKAIVEIKRGCEGGCRFCQAGFINRPVRHAPLTELADKSIAAVCQTGFDELSFLSLSSGNFSELEQLLSSVNQEFRERRISVSLPSLRLDKFGIKVARMLGSVKHSTLTFAPEAGSQRMRDVINKNLSERQIFDTVDSVLQEGYQRIKLYFMIGLPFEEFSDIEQIVELVLKIQKLGRSYHQGKFKLSVSVNAFVPKPHTPFSWCSLASEDYLKTGFEFLFKMLGKSRKIDYSWSDIKQSECEALLARGDYRAGLLAIRLARMGLGLQTEFEHFDYNSWLMLAQELELDMSRGQVLPSETVFPWDLVDIGVNKDYLISEFRRAEAEKLTPLCSPECKRCGVCT